MFKISLITGWSSRSCKRFIRCGYQVKCIKYLDDSMMNNAFDLEVIQKLEQEKPDLIVVEEYHFLSAIKQLKNNTITQNIPILFTPVDPEREWFKRIEFDDCCSKNAGIVELNNKIEILLKQKPTIELILEIVQANPQGLTFNEIDSQIDSQILEFILNSLVNKGRIRSKEQEEQLVYYPVQ